MLCVLFACQNNPQITDNSPAIISFDATSGSENTENSQFVKVSIQFDKPISVGKNAKSAIRIAVNGNPPDKSTMDYSVAKTSGDETGIEITLHALPSAQSPNKGKYFALYNGAIQIDMPKALPNSITSADGKSLVRWDTINLIAPSGLSISVETNTEGNESQGKPASLTFRVDKTPNIRVVSWLQLRLNGEPVMREDFQLEEYSYQHDGSIPVHFHYFMQTTPESCAKTIAERLNHYFADTYSLVCTQNGDKVTITRLHATDSELLSIAVMN